MKIFIFLVALSYIAAKVGKKVEKPIKKVGKPKGQAKDQSLQKLLSAIAGSKPQLLEKYAKKTNGNKKKPIQKKTTKIAKTAETLESMVEGEEPKEATKIETIEQLLKKPIKVTELVVIGDEEEKSEKSEKPKESEKSEESEKSTKIETLESMVEDEVEAKEATKIETVEELLKKPIEVTELIVIGNEEKKSEKSEESEKSTKIATLESMVDGEKEGKEAFIRREKGAIQIVAIGGEESEGAELEEVLESMSASLIGPVEIASSPLHQVSIDIDIEKLKSTIGTYKMKTDEEALIHKIDERIKADGIAPESVISKIVQIGLIETPGTDGTTFTTKVTVGAYVYTTKETNPPSPADIHTSIFTIDSSE